MQQNEGKNDRIKPAACARALGINRATMHRYLENHPDLKDARGLVDLDEVRRHRDDNPIVALPGEAEAKEPRAAPAAESAGSRRGTKHRLEEIKSWQAELEFAKQIGQLVDPDTMIDALAEAAVALRDKFMAPDPVLCERIAGETDPRAVMALVREANRELLDDFAATMKRIAGESAAAPSNAGA